MTLCWLFNLVSIVMLSYLLYWFLKYFVIHTLRVSLYLLKRLYFSALLLTHYAARADLQSDRYEYEYLRVDNTFCYP